MKKRIISILALALVFTGCSFNNSNSDSDTADALASMFADEEDISTGANNSAAKDTSSAAKSADDSSSKAATKERNGAPGSDNVVSDKPVGIYSREYTEEIDGQEVKQIFSVTFNEDGTGSLTLQDTVKITWADGKITTEGGDTYEYEFKPSTDVLRIKEESGWEDYCKK
ncbi:hypothetical protein [Butyrivibrio sp. M55]|uniref:hypothetical protein n=1 Tax=Butyrivibrio sp. M55 TaxID=1855323 RepID=UPI0008F33CC1|nr:hypothetical protein [Butyrivibrio sp. M55]SFU64299.1 hypothetical protein SAMN05216540_10542 [Butyrivibrio sp. M55]